MTSDSTLTISINGINDAPEAIGSIRQMTIREDVLWEFSFAAEGASGALFRDVDGDTLIYTAVRESGGIESGLPSWLKFDSGERKFSGTPREDDVASTLIIVKATDPGGLIDTLRFTLDVENVDDEPEVVNPVPPQVINEDEAWRVVLQDNQPATNVFLDEDDTRLKFKVTQVVNGVEVTLPGWLTHGLDSSIVLMGTPRNEHVGTITIRLTATDPDMLSASTDFALTVRNTNDAPTLEAESTPAPKTEVREAGGTNNGAMGDPVGNGRFLVRDVDAGSAPVIQGRVGNSGDDWLEGDDDANDEDGTEFLGTYGHLYLRADGHWIYRLENSRAVTEALTNASANIAETFTFRADDGTADMGTRYSPVRTVKIDVMGANDAPTAMATPKTADEEGTYSFMSSEFNFSDVDQADTLQSISITLLPERGDLEFDGTLVNSHPFLVSIGDLGKLKLRTRNRVSNYNIAFNFTVSDGSLSSLPAVFTIAVTADDDLPIATAIGPRSVSQGMDVDSDISSSFTDPEGLALAYTATLTDDSELPMWLTLGRDTGVFKGIPQQADVDAGALDIRVTATDPGGNKANSDFRLTIVNVNDAPTSAGGSVSVDEEATHTFAAGEFSFNDVDDGETLQAVTVTSQPAATDGRLALGGSAISSLPQEIAIAQIGTLVFTPANKTAGYTARFMFTVSDGTVSSMAAEMVISVAADDDDPTVGTAIGPRGATQDVGISLNIAGSFSDPEGLALVYTATLMNGDPLPDWLTLGRDSGIFDGTPRQADVGALDIRVTAMDPGGNDVSDDFTLTVGNVNDAPTLALSNTDTDVRELGAVMGDASASGTITANDVDAGQTPAVEGIVGASGGTVWTAAGGAAINGTYGRLSLTSTTWTYTLDDTRTATDELNGGDAVTDTFRVRANDGTAQSEPMTIMVAVAGANDAPTTSGGAVSVGEEDTYTFAAGEFSFSDVDDGETLQAVTVTSQPAATDGRLALGGSAISSLPREIAIAQIGTLVFTPANKTAGYTARFMFTVGDGAAASVAAEMVISVTADDDDPTVGTAIGPRSATQDVEISLNIAGSFRDPEGLALAYTATLMNGDPLPDWLTLGRDSGIFDGTPRNADVGTLDIRVTAMDPGGNDVSDDFTLTVGNVNDAPMLALNNTDTDVRELGAVMGDASASGTITANDVDAGQTPTVEGIVGASGGTGWTAAGGAAINGTYGRLSLTSTTWTYTLDDTRTATDELNGGDAVTDTFRVRANDGTAQSEPMTIMVAVAGANDAPTTSDGAVSVGEEGTYTFAAGEFSFSDVDDGETLQAVTVTSQPAATDGRLALGGSAISSLPREIAIAQIGTLVFTPANKTAGYTARFMFTVGDGAAASVAAEMVISVTADDDDPTVGTTIGPRSATQDVEISLNIAGSFRDPEGLALAYTATLMNGDPLPDWLTLGRDSGIFDGTPRNADVGTLDIRVKATDPGGNDVSDDFTLTVGNVNDAPMLALNNTDTDVRELGAVMGDASASGTITANDVDAGQTPTVEGIVGASGGTKWTAAGGAAINGTYGRLSLTSTTWTYTLDDTRTATDELNGGDAVTDTFRVRANDGTAQSEPMTIMIAVAGANDAPTTSDGAVSVGEEATHTFAAGEFSFSDVDDGETLQAVTVTSQPAATDGRLALGGSAISSLPREIAIAQIGTLVFTPANKTAGYTARFMFTVGDGAAASMAAEMVISVAADDDDPTVGTAIGPRGATQDIGISLNIAGSFSDPEGLALAYTATLMNGDPLPDWLTLGRDSGIFDGTPRQADVGALDIRVTAMDPGGNDVSDDFTLTVGNVNDAPTLALSNTDTDVRELGAVMGDASASGTITANDVDAGQTPTVEGIVGASGGTGWTAAGGAAINGTYGRLSLTSTTWAYTLDDTRTATDELNGGDAVTDTFRVRANDGTAQSEPMTIMVAVAGANDAPTTSDGAVSVVEEGTHTFAAGEFSFSDVDDGETLQAVTVTSQPAAIDGRLALGGSAISSLPQEIAIAQIGTLVFTPANKTAGYTARFMFTVGDGAVASMAAEMVISVAADDDDPTVGTTIGPRGATQDVGISLNIAGSFSDPEGLALVYTATLMNGDPLPDWLTLGLNSGAFVGTPRQADVGALDIRVTAMDPGGNDVSDDFTLTVGNVNDAPTLALSNTDTDVRELGAVMGDASASGTITANDVDAGQTAAVEGIVGASGGTRWTAAGGAAINGTYGRLSLTSTTWAYTLDDTRTATDELNGGDAVTDTFRVRANDGTTQSEPMTIMVAVAGANDAPITSGGAVSVGEEGTHTFAAGEFSFSDVDDGETLQAVTVTSQPAAIDGRLALGGSAIGSLPREIAIAQIGTLVFTPANKTAGYTARFMFTVGDGAAASMAAEMVISVTADDDDPTVGTAIGPRSATQDVEISLNIAGSFSDPEGLALAYTATLTSGSALPDWLTLGRDSGIFDGTPRNADVGTLDIRVTATDPGGNTGFDDFTLTVANVNDAPELTEDAGADTSVIERGVNSQGIVVAGDSRARGRFRASDPDGTAPDIQGQSTASGVWRTAPATLRGAYGSLSLSANGGWEYTLDDDRAVTNALAAGARVSDAFSFRASDGAETSGPLPLEISVAGTNDVPTLEMAIDDHGVAKESRYARAIAEGTFMDPDAGDTLDWSATLGDDTALPVWLSFDAGSRELSGTPPRSAAASLSIKVTVDDRKGGRASDTFTLTLQDAPLPTFRIVTLSTNATEDPIRFAVERVGSVMTSAMVEVTVASPDGYVDPGPRTLSLAHGESSKPLDLARVMPDTRIDADGGTIVATIQPLPTYLVAPGQGSASFMVTDTRPAFGIGQTPMVTGASVTFTLNRIGSHDGGATVMVDITSPGGRVSGVQRTVAFAMDEDTATLVLPITGDITIGDTVTATLARNGAYATSANTRSATAVIPAILSVVSISGTNFPTRVVEGGMTTIMFERTRPETGGLQAYAHVTSASLGTPIALGIGFGENETTAAADLSIPAGILNGDETATVTVLMPDDTALDGQNPAPGRYLAGTGDGLSRSFTLVNINSPPRATGLKPPDARVRQVYALDMNRLFIDPDGDDMTFSISEDAGDMCDPAFTVSGDRLVGSGSGGIIPEDTLVEVKTCVVKADDGEAPAVKASLAIEVLEENLHRHRVELILTGLARTLGWDAVDAIRERTLRVRDGIAGLVDASGLMDYLRTFAASKSSATSEPGFAGELPAASGAPDAGLADSGAVGVNARAAATEDARAASSGRQVWTNVTRSELMVQGDESTQDGELVTARLGLERQDGDWLLGVAVNHAWGEVKLVFSDREESSVDLRQWMVTPYASLTRGATRIWGMLGLGTGTLDYHADGGRISTSSRTLSQMVAAGTESRHTVPDTSGRVEIVFRGEAMASGLTAKGTSAYDRVSAWTRGTRGEIEVGLPQRSRDSYFRPYVTAGWRMDRGAGLSSSAFEYGTGFVAETSDLQMAISIRTQGGGDYDRRSYMLDLSFDRGGDQRGWTANLLREHGLERSDPFVRFHPGGEAPAGSDALSFRLGYGASAHQGLLTPYIKTQLESGQFSSIRFGLDYERGDIRLTLGHTARPGSARKEDEHEFSLIGQMRF